MSMLHWPANINTWSAIHNLLISPRSFTRQCFSSHILSSEDCEDIKILASWLPQLTSKACTANGAGRPTVLIASLMPIPYSLKMETMFARALEQRGYHVVVLTNLATFSLVEAYHGCLNGYLILVIENFIRTTRFSAFNQLLDKLFENDEELIPKVKQFRYRDAYVGLHALATVSAAVTDGRIELTKENRLRLRRTLKRSMHLMDAASKIINLVNPEKMITNEKGFVGTSELFYAALNDRVDFVQWTNCHEPNSIMLKRYSWQNFREHPFSISDESWNRILALPWKGSYRDDMMAQFTKGYEDGAWFRYKSLSSDQRQMAKCELLRQLGLNVSKKTAVIYSHILNDANLFYGQDLFQGGYEEWLVETIRAAGENHSVNWVLKLHPSNVYRNAKLGYSGEYGEILALKRAFGRIPEFLHVVYPDDKVSPLSFFGITDYGITVRGTVGLELPCFGVPTLTAGTGRYAGKGFTIDSGSRSEYLERIRNIEQTKELSEEQIRLGQLYAYFVFRARPARYGAMFSDIYNFPVNHPQFRDIKIGDISLDAVLMHPQMQQIVSFLCSAKQDFLNLSII